MSERLDLALHAHGGLERWRQVQSLVVCVSLTGGLYYWKRFPAGVAEALSLEGKVTAPFRLGDNPRQRPPTPQTAPPS